MALHRNRWLPLLVGLALCMQLLIASGLAMSAPTAHCGSSHTQTHTPTMNGEDCQACGSDGDVTTAHSVGMCEVACALASVAAPLPLRVFTVQAPRDAAPTSTASVQDQSSADVLLRPPAEAAVRAA